MPGPFFYKPKSSLTRDENNLKEITRHVLILAHLLKSNSEAEWNDFATIHILHDPEIMKFVHRYLEGGSRPKEPEKPKRKAVTQEKPVEKAAPERPSASRRSPGSDRRGKGSPRRSSSPGRSIHGRSAGSKA